MCYLCISNQNNRRDFIFTSKIAGLLIVMGFVLFCICNPNTDYFSLNSIKNNLKLFFIFYYILPLFFINMLTFKSSISTGSGVIHIMLSRHRRVFLNNKIVMNCSDGILLTSYSNIIYMWQTCYIPPEQTCIIIDQIELTIEIQ